MTKHLPPSFSSRHMQILKLLAKGMNSSDIAKKLFISKHTVDTHRRAMLKKAGCPNTIALINFCRSHGIL